MIRPEFRVPNPEDLEPTTIESESDEDKKKARIDFYKENKDVLRELGFKSLGDVMGDDDSFAEIQGKVAEYNTAHEDTEPVEEADVVNPEDGETKEVSPQERIQFYRENKDALRAMNYNSIADLPTNIDELGEIYLKIKGETEEEPADVETKPAVSPEERAERATLIANLTSNQDAVRWLVLNQGFRTKDDFDRLSTDTLRSFSEQLLGAPKPAEAEPVVAEEAPAVVAEEPSTEPEAAPAAEPEAEPVTEPESEPEPVAEPEEEPDVEKEEQEKKVRIEFYKEHRVALRELGHKTIGDLIGKDQDEIQAIKDKVLEFEESRKAEEAPVVDEVEPEDTTAEPEAEPADETEELNMEDEVKRLVDMDNKELSETLFAEYGDRMKELGHSSPEEVAGYSDAQLNELITRLVSEKLSGSAIEDDDFDAAYETKESTVEVDEEAEKAERMKENAKYYAENKDILRALGYRTLDALNNPDLDIDELKAKVEKAANVSRFEAWTIGMLEVPNGSDMMPEDYFLRDNFDSVQASAKAWNSYGEAERRLMLSGQFESFGASAGRRLAEMMDLADAGFVTIPEDIELPKFVEDIPDRFKGKFESAAKIDGVDEEQVMLVEYTPEEIEDLVAYGVDGSSEEKSIYADQLKEAAHIWNTTALETRQQILRGENSSDDNARKALETLSFLSQIGNNVPLVGSISGVRKASKMMLARASAEEERKERIDNFEPISGADDIRNISVSPTRIREIAGRELNQWDINSVYYAINGWNNLPDEQKKQVLEGTFDENASDTLRSQLDTLREYGLIPGKAEEEPESGDSPTDEALPEAAQD